MAYSEWLSIYYQITPVGKKHAGIVRKLIRGFGFVQSEIIVYLARFPNSSRSLAQIWEGTSFQMTRNGMLKAIEALKRKEWIKKVKKAP